MLSVLGAAAAVLVAAAVALSSGGGPEAAAPPTGATTTTAPSTTTPATTGAAATAPPATAAPAATTTTTTTEAPPATAPPATAPPPRIAVPGVVRAANPIVHGGYDDADCDGLVLDYAAVQPRQLRLPGEPVARVRTAVLVDLSSEPASLEEAEYSMELAGQYLYDLTGFGFEMTEYVEATPPRDDFIEALIPHCYLQTLDDLPDHVVLFSYGYAGNARSFGGYAEYLDARSPFASWAPAGWSNRFTNATFGGVQMYVSVIHWSHSYARCGYGSSETPVTDVAIDGECSNLAGTACAAGPDYQICSTELSSPYAYRANFRASTIVHELMHPFGLHGNGDHVGAPECNAEMGLPEGTFDEETAERHHQMCPYTYEEFARGFAG